MLNVIHIKLAFVLHYLTLSDWFKKLVPLSFPTIRSKTKTNCDSLNTCDCVFSWMLDTCINFVLSSDWFIDLFNYIICDWP